MKKSKSMDPETCEDYRCLKSCSAQDCTGLIPNGMTRPDELENYESLYPFLPKIPRSGQNKQEFKNSKS